MAQTQDRITRALELLQDEPAPKKGKRKTYICMIIGLLLACAVVAALLYAWLGNTNSYEDDYIKLRYVPEGFVLTEYDEESLPVNLNARFENGTSFFSVECYGLDGTNMIDTENSIVEDITLNGYEGVYIHNSRFNAVLWHTSENYVSVLGEISKEELIKVAENFIKK